MALLNVETSTLEISQFKETHSYATLRLLIHMHQPKEILFPANISEGHLATLLRTYAQTSKLELCQRKYFNENKGQLYLRQLSSTNLPFDAGGFYLALGCVAALIKV